MPPAVAPALAMRGAITSSKELPLPYSGTLDGRAHILLDGDGKTFFAKEDGTAIGSDKPPITYYRYDIEDGTSATVLEATGIGDGQEICTTSLATGTLDGAAEGSAAPK